MKTRTFVILLLLAILLGSLTFLDYRSRVTRLIQEEESTRLMTGPLDEIAAILIENPSETIELEKRDGKWWVTSPILDIADEELINGTLLRDLEAARKANRFPVEPVVDSDDTNTTESLDAYGLQSPIVKLTLHAASPDARPVQLWFGRQTPVVGTSYVMDLAEPGFAYTVPTSLVENLIQSSTFFRDKRILDMPDSGVTRFRIGRNDEILSFDLQSDGRWALNKEVASTTTLATNADSNIVNALLRDIHNAQAIAFITTRTLDLETFGLDEPTAFFEYHAEPPGHPEQGRLLIGAPIVVREGIPLIYAAMQEGREAIFLISGGAAATIPNRLLLPDIAYQDRGVFSLMPGDVAYAQVEAITSITPLERNSEGLWQFPDQPEIRIDQNKVEEFLSYALALRIEEFPDPPIDAPEAVRLNHPTLRITMANRDRSIREGLEIGAAMPDQPFFYARRSPHVPRPGEPEIFLVGMPLETFHGLMKTRNQFIHRHLLQFDAAHVHRIIVESRRDDDEALTLTIDIVPENPDICMVRMGERNPVSIPRYRADLLLASLEALEMIARGNEAHEDFIQETGLSDPAHTILLLDADGKELTLFSFGILPENVEEMPVLVERNQAALAEGKGFAGVIESINGIIDMLP